MTKAMLVIIFILIIVIVCLLSFVVGLLKKINGKLDERKDRENNEDEKE